MVKPTAAPTPMTMKSTMIKRCLRLGFMKIFSPYAADVQDQTSLSSFAELD